MGLQPEFITVLKIYLNNNQFLLTLTNLSVPLLDLHPFINIISDEKENVTDNCKNAN